MSRPRSEEGGAQDNPFYSSGWEIRGLEPPFLSGRRIPVSFGHAAALIILIVRGSCYIPADENRKRQKLT